MFKLYDFVYSAGFKTNERKTGTNINIKRTDLFLVRMLLIFLVLFLNCNTESGFQGSVNDSEGTQDMSQVKIKDVLREHTDELMALPGVVGTGQGLCDGKPCIKVFVMQLTPELEEKIPKSIKGFKVEAVETGQFQVFPEKENNNE